MLAAVRTLSKQRSLTGWQVQQTRGFPTEVSVDFAEGYQKLCTDERNHT
jgi:hypothetical protein